MLLIVLLLALGGVALYTYQQNQIVKAATQPVIEYRALPPSLDNWFEPMQPAPIDVMNDMTSTTAGTCTTTLGTYPTVPPVASASSVAPSSSVSSLAPAAVAAF